MEVVAELLFTLLDFADQFRPKQAFMLVAFIVLGLFGLFVYSCQEINSKQFENYTDIVTTALDENLKATERKAMQIEEDNKITRLEFSDLKALYDKELKYSKIKSQKMPT